MGFSVHKVTETQLGYLRSKHCWAFILPSGHTNHKKIHLDHTEALTWKEHYFTSNRQESVWLDLLQNEDEENPSVDNPSA